MDTKLLGKYDKSNTKVIPDHPQNITIDRLKALLPHNTNVAVTQEIIDIVNRMEDDTGLPQELLEEDLMSYTHLIGNMPGVGMKDLVNAIKYCNLKRNYPNKEAWAIVFPDRYNKLASENRQIDSHVSMYNRSKLVFKVDSEMLIPVSFQYAAHFHAATKELFKIGVLGQGGLDAKGAKMTVTPMVRVQALKELTVLTKPLEEQKLAITVNPGEAAVNMQQEMNDQLKAIVANQRQQLEDGADIIDVQAIGLDFSDVGKVNE